MRLHVSMVVSPNGTAGRQPACRAGLLKSCRGTTGRPRRPSHPIQCVQKSDATARTQLVQILVVRTADGDVPSREVLLGLWGPDAPFGLSGRYTGLLGQVDPSIDRTLEDAALRHAYDLGGIHIASRECLEKRAIFHFDDDVEEHEYFCNASFVPQNTAVGSSDQSRHGDDAMAAPSMMTSLAWFKQDEIPYNQMPADDAIWYPPFLNGQKIRGFFNFDAKEDPTLLTSCRVEEVASLLGSCNAYHQHGPHHNEARVLYQKL